jgi:PAS domain-containing protein
MHFVGMAATRFMSADAAPDLARTVDVSALGIGGVAGVSAMTLGVALITALVDRLRQQRALLDELFEQAPQAVALLDASGRVVRVNREFTRLFGYAPREALGRRLGDLTAPMTRERRRAT